MSCDTGLASRVIQSRDHKEESGKVTDLGCWKSARSRENPVALLA